MQVLDPALTRPGRLSRRVVVPLPDERGRADILQVHLRVVPLAPELDRASACRALAKITGGFSGAELANVVNEAALLAGRKEAEVICPLSPLTPQICFVYVVLQQADD
jgi:cell division protease FtsH